MGAVASPFLDPNTVTERQLQNVVIGFARARRWLVHHSRPAVNRSGKWATHIEGHTGFPDLVLARDGRVVMIELKSEGGRVSTTQRMWHDQLPEVLVVRPSEWPQLAEVLW